MSAMLIVYHQRFLHPSMHPLLFCSSSFHVCPIALPTVCAPLRPTVPHCAPLRPTAPHCAPLRPTAPHCAPQCPTAPHCAPLRPTAPNCAPLRPTAPHCAQLRPSAPLCAPLRPTVPHCKPPGLVRLVHLLSRRLGRRQPRVILVDSGTGTTAVGCALGAHLLG